MAKVAFAILSTVASGTERRIGHVLSVVVLPTRYAEGIPRVLLEAAACGKAVVASDIPGCRAVVYNGQNGTLVPPGDTERLCQAVEALLGDPVLRAKMGRRGRELVAERFSEDRITLATLRLYDELLNST